MKTKIQLLTLCLVLLGGVGGLAQNSTIIPYNGILNAPSNGSYVVSGTLWDASTNGILLAADYIHYINFTNGNGRFTVNFQFGDGVWKTNQDIWLQISVRPNDSVSQYTDLWPRKLITLYPKAIYAQSAASADFANRVKDGSIGSTALQPGSVNSNSLAVGQVVRSLNGLHDDVTLAAGPNMLVTKSGQTITVSSTVSSANNWTLNGNIGTDPTINFIGTSDGQPLVLKGANVGVNKTTPATALDVNGVVTATGFSGSGSGLTGIGSQSLAPGAVTSGALADGAVTSAKLTTGAVNTAAIAPGSVTPDKLSQTLSTSANYMTFTNPIPTISANFGWAVAAMGADRVVIGSVDFTGVHPAAYLYNTNGTLLTTFISPESNRETSYGNSVEVVGPDEVIIGAPGSQVTGFAGNFGAGAAFLFNTNGTLLRTFVSPFPNFTNAFGFMVRALGSDRVLISEASWINSGSGINTNQGRVYIFNLNGTLLTTFTNPNSGLGRFGNCMLALGTDRVLISDDIATNVYLYDTNGILIKTFTPPDQNNFLFGLAVATMGTDKVLIGGAPESYLYSTNGNLLMTFVDPNPIQAINGSGFGKTIAALGTDKVCIGSPWVNEVHIFGTNGALLSTFTTKPFLTNFLNSVIGYGQALAALGGDELLVGSPNYDAPDSSMIRMAGEVYLYTIGSNLYSPLISAGVADNSITTSSLVDGAVTGKKISDGQVVRSLNSLHDDIVLAAGNNITLGTSGNTLTIAANLPAANYWGTAGNSGTDPMVNFLGTTDNQDLALRVNGMQALRLSPNNLLYQSPNLIGGSPLNGISASLGSVIAGGGTAFASGSNNISSANYASILGGALNTIQAANAAAIGGGDGNSIGNGSIASVIGGGEGNVINSNSIYSTIPGGKNNSATNYAFAAGNRAKANRTGAFVWADSQAADFLSVSNNEFAVRANGGVRLVTSGAGLMVDGVPINGTAQQISGTYSNAVTFNNPSNNFTGIFTGNGAGLTNLSIASFPTNIAFVNSNQTFTASNLFAGVVTATNLNNRFAGNGGGLTNLNATNLVGTVADTQLSTNVALLAGSQTFSGAKAMTNGGNTFVGGFTGSFSGNGAGVTNLNPANLTSGTAGISISGNASTATIATIATLAGSFSGSLAGEVTGTQGSTAVALVSGMSAASVTNGAGAANNATSGNIPNTIVKRDATGSFNAGTINATNFAGNGGGLTNLNPANLTGGTANINISGSAATATSAFSATTAVTAGNFSGLLGGDVSGAQAGTVVGSVGGQTAGAVASGASAANAATSANTPNTIVKRDATGGFNAGTIVATNFTGNGAGLTNLNLAGLINSNDWSRAGNAGTDPSTNFIGTTDNKAFEIRANNRRGLRLEPVAKSVNVIGGDPQNSVDTGIVGATIAGGGNDASPFSAPNNINGDYGTVGGGLNNSATNRATVGGGELNTASGNYATVPGGYGNYASDNSFAAGRQARANHSGSFVWADASGGSFATSRSNTFIIRATGGVGIGVTNPNSLYALHVGGSALIEGDMLVVKGSGSELPYLAGDGGKGIFLGGAGSLVTDVTLWNTIRAARMNFYAAAADFSGSLNMNANSINLSGGFNGLSYNTMFGGQTINGPVLYGLNGGALGLNVNSTKSSVLTWNASSIDLYNSTYLNNRPLYLRDDVTPNHDHGLAYCGTGNLNFGTVSPDGPVLWGYAGGALGVVQGGNHAVLTWTNGGVSVNGGFSYSSDRALKTGFDNLNAQEILARVVSLPVRSWFYKTDAGARHVGPMAQDFHSAFELGGSDEKHINVGDETGVALAAIQGLNQKMESENAVLRAENRELKNDILEIRQLLIKLTGLKN